MQSVTFSSVVHDDSGGLDCLELKVNVDGGVRSELGEGHEGRDGLKCYRMVNSWPDLAERSSYLQKNASVSSIRILH